VVVTITLPPSYSSNTSPASVTLPHATSLEETPSGNCEMEETSVSPAGREICLVSSCV